MLIWLRWIKQKIMMDGVDIHDPSTLAGQLYELAMSLKYYPLICIISAVWSIIVEIVRFSSSTPLESWMVTALVVGQQSVGLFCCVLYVYNLRRSGQLLCCICGPQAEVLDAKLDWSMSASAAGEEYIRLLGCLSVSRRLFIRRPALPVRSQIQSVDSQASSKNPIIAGSISDLNSFFATDEAEQTAEGKPSIAISHGKASSMYYNSTNITSSSSGYPNVAIDMALNSPESSMSMSESDDIEGFDDSFKVAILGTPAANTPYTPGGRKEGDHIVRVTAPQLVPPNMAGLSAAVCETPQQKSKHR
jgi:hypothetical protein